MHERTTAAGVDTLSYDAYAAAIDGRTDAVAAWLDDGGAVDAVYDAEDSTDGGITMLMISAMYGHVELVRLLLERGAATGMTDSRGFTALGYATLREHTAILKLLQHAGRNNS